MRRDLGAGVTLEKCFVLVYLTVFSDHVRLLHGTKTAAAMDPCDSLASSSQLQAPAQQAMALPHHAYQHDGYELPPSALRSRVGPLDLPLKHVLCAAAIVPSLLDLFKPTPLNTIQHHSTPPNITQRHPTRLNLPPWPSRTRVRPCSRSSAATSSPTTTAVSC
jgi:hypothetical protein